MKHGPAPAGRRGFVQTYPPRRDPDMASNGRCLHVSRQYRAAVEESGKLYQLNPAWQSIRTLAGAPALSRARRIDEAKKTLQLQTSPT